MRYCALGKTGVKGEPVIGEEKHARIRSGS